MDRPVAIGPKPATARYDSSVTDHGSVRAQHGGRPLSVLWPASQIPDTGPYRVRTGMEDGKCQNGAGSISPEF